MDGEKDGSQGFRQKRRSKKRRSTFIMFKSFLGIKDSESSNIDNELQNDDRISENDGTDPENNEELKDSKSFSYFEDNCLEVIEKS
ncbi:MAG: hypothetical protein MHPSP_001396, partial [Paramarteilia canceri]